MNSNDTQLPCQMPDMPKPQEQHLWLKRLIGHWQSDVECYMGGDEPVFTNTGSEKFSALGDFWVVSEIKSDSPEFPFCAQMTLGYDAEKSQYVGTWVDSMAGFLWNYTGSVDQTGNVLTFFTEGPCPMAPGKLTKFREVTEILDEKTKRFTSSMLGEDGNWKTCMVVNAKRVG